MELPVITFRFNILSFFKFVGNAHKFNLTTRDKTGIVKLIKVMLKVMLKHIYSVYLDILHSKRISTSYEILGLKFLKLRNCEAPADHVLHS